MSEFQEEIAQERYFVFVEGVVGLLNFAQFESDTGVLTVIYDTGLSRNHEAQTQWHKTSKRTAERRHLR
uniref:Uncharacterized protein n=1 Tax=mine drainage metagenome TaxID=410659 RepID=E6PYL0_9ZZZZ